MFSRIVVAGADSGAEGVRLEMGDLIKIYYISNRRHSGGEKTK